jgi:hypothetical protein
MLKQFLLNFLLVSGIIILCLVCVFFTILLIFTQPIIGSIILIICFIFVVTYYITINPED